MGPCRKCGCKSFYWNPVSGFQKLVSGGKVSGNINGVEISYQTQANMDNKTDQAAYRNCFCGHHYNYH